MARFRQIQASFVAGALDPTMFGRVDTDIYTKAAKTLDNVYIRPQGGAFRREGLEYEDNTTTEQTGRLVPFEFNEVQTYMLLFTPGEFKVYRTDIVGTVQATVTSAPIDALTADQIAEMTWTQSADTLLLFHNDVQTIKITRTAHTTWTAAAVTYTNIPAHAYGSLTITTPAGSLVPDVTTGEVIITGTGTSFDATFVGQFINMPKGGRIFIRSFTSTTVMEGVVTIELANTDSVSTGDWEKETGYEDVISGSRGWPATGAFWKSRLWLGFVGERPQTFLASKIGDFFNLDEASGLDSDAINITIDDDRVNQIKYLFPGRGLQIFTTGGEFSIRTSLSDPVTPSNIANLLSKETLHGTAAIRPQSVDGTTVFIEEDGAVVRQFVFNDIEQSFNAPNISITSQNLITAPVAMDIRRGVATHPSDFLYIVTGDGNVAVLNSLREQELLAWSRFTTTGSFKDVAVSGRKVYFLVERTINSVTVMHLENLNADHFMDASTRVDNGSPTTSWTGLDHLDGELVQVRGDDFILDDATPSSGAITSSEAVTILEAGLFKASIVETLPLDIIIQGQSFAGEYKSLQKTLVRLHQSRNIVAFVNGNRREIAFREFGPDVLDDPIVLFDGWKQIFGGGISRDTAVKFTQEEPLEFNILGYTYTLRV